MDSQFKAGDIVIIKSEYRNSDEGDERYVVVEWNGDRGFITLVESDFKIKPNELVRNFQIEKI